MSEIERELRQQEGEQWLLGLGGKRCQVTWALLAVVLIEACSILEHWGVTKASYRRVTGPDWYFPETYLLQCGE